MGVAGGFAAGSLADMRPKSSDDDLVVSIADASASEGHTVAFKVSVSRQRSVPLQVDWKLSSATATAIAGVDFQPVQGGTLRIPAGATEGLIRVRTLEDELAEPDDTFEVSLIDVTPIPPDGALVSEEFHTATGTILNDDGDFALPDSALRRAIQHELGKSPGDALTTEDLAALDRLVAGDGIDDLAGIQFATNLTDLWLFGSRVVDLSPLAQLRDLTSLRMAWGVLRDLSPLRTMTQLRELILQDNAIIDLEPLRGLNRLQRLNLSRNDITDIGPLHGLTSLRVLFLGTNLITDVAPLAGLPALYQLKLDENAISNVSPLRDMPSLSWLSVTDNSISDIAPLVQLNGMQALYLARNAISDIAPLLAHEGFAAGNRFYLHDNPLSNEALSTHVPALREAGARVYTVSANIADTSAPEGEPLVFRVNLSAPVEDPVDLVWWVDHRRFPTRDLDYTTPGGDLDLITIPPGETAAEVTVPTNRDQEDENHEPLIMRLSEPQSVSTWQDHPGLPTGVAMGRREAPMTAVGLILEPGAPIREIPFVESADHERRQSLVRIVNRQRQTPTTVRIEAFDDAGEGRDPVALPIEPGAAKQFTSRDLENGSAIKGLFSGVGAGRGDWRLQVQSNDIQAYAYMRSADGLLTGMNDLVPLTSIGYFVPIFNPGRNRNQVSWLRLTNKGDRTASVRISGIDDAGTSPGSEVKLRVAAGESRLFSASMLESGTGSGVEGALGTGTGKWRLIVASDLRLDVMNLLESPTGHLSNLSTLAARIESAAGADTTHLVPLFPSATDPSGREGLVRVINWADETARVRIGARDDGRREHAPVTLTVEPGGAVQFNSRDLESGNPHKGLNKGTGAGEGDWRLELTSAQPIDVGAYIRTQDGFLSSMHDLVAPVAGEHFVPYFNPGRNRAQESLLRLINNGTRTAEVRVRAVDDRGRTPGDEVLLHVGRQSARTIPSRVLEKGRWGLVGGFGTGYGKWRLTVSSDTPIEVMNLLQSPTGHLSNLSIPAEHKSQASQAPSRPSGFTTISGQRRITQLGDVRVRDAQAVDLDRDGDVDVVAAIDDVYGNGRIVWYPNRGDGTFTGERRIADVDEGRAVAVLDVNGDRVADVAYATGDDTVAWHENLGGGDFSGPRPIGDPGDDQWEALAAADLDGDGDTDLVVASFLGNRLVWFENTGGNFAAVREIEATLGDSSTLTVHDLDGDGDPDIAPGTTPGGEFVWLENLGDGAFASARVIFADRFAPAVAVADLDLDGDADLVMGSWGDDVVGWAENLGNGRFSDFRAIVDNVRSSVPFLATGDLDGDGDADLVCHCHTDGKLAWIRNQGEGRFAEARLIDSSAEAYLLQLADMDGDGDADLFVLQERTYDTILAWYENLDQAPDTMRFRITAEVGQLWVSWDPLSTTGDRAALHNVLVTAVAEDGDHRRTCRASLTNGCTVTGLVPGVTYQVTVEVEGGARRTARSSATPLEDAPVKTEISMSRPIAEPDPGREIDHLEAVDLNGDGDVDLFYLRPLYWRQNTGAGDFSEERTIATDRLGAIEVADLDGDADLDLLHVLEVAGGSNNRELSWRENLGEGDFSEPQGFAEAADRVVAIETADLDLDGDLDVVTTLVVRRENFQSDYPVHWHENLGDGNFASSRELIADLGDSVSGVGVIATDLDSDGDTDLLTDLSIYGDGGRRQIEWYANLGNGAFSPKPIVRLDDHNEAALHPTDIDGDGDTDILAMPIDQGELSWYANLGAGRFSGERVIATDHVYRSIDVADMNDDGHPDLVYTTRLYDDLLLWRENLGAGVFSQDRLIADHGRGEWSAVAADVDADGDPDVLSLNHYDGEIRWYENLHTATAPTQAPANIRIVPGAGTLWVTWDAVPGLGESQQAMARYEVAAVGADGTVAARCIAESLIGCTLTGLAAGERYRVTVQAQNVAGEGPLSEAVTAPPLAGFDPPGTVFATGRVVATDVAEANSIRAGDMDGDSDLDLVATLTEDDRIVWWENSGTGFFTGNQLVANDLSGPVVALPRDIDRDGDGDVLSASFYDRLVSWHENLGNAGFSAANVIATDITYSTSVAGVDLDADGWTDVLLGGAANGAVAWYRNQGNGQFAGPRVIDQPDRQVLAEVAAIDFDRDGDTDVLSAPGSAPAMRWHENLGQDAFHPPRVVASGFEYEYTTFLGAADLDGDGDADIVHASSDDLSLAWHENLGGGTVLGRRVIALDIEAGHAVNVVDLDGDGDLDLVVGDYEEDEIVWYENLHRGQFSGAHVIASDLDGFSDLHSADLDGDGDFDVISATRGDAAITWYENLD